MLPLVVFLAFADPNLTQPSLLDAGFHQMYDLQFDEAHRTFQQWKGQHPEDPMGPVCDAAAYLFTELDRLKILQSEFFLHDDAFLNRAKPAADAALKQKFDAALVQSQQLGDRALAKNPQDQNAQFATLMRLGLRSDYLALIEKKYLASLSDVKQSRAFAEKLIAANPAMADAYLAVGVENYLLSLKAAPLRWFLRLDGAQTDKQRGIDDLSIAAQRDKNVPRAKELLAGLAREFPRNPLYSQELARLR